MKRTENKYLRIRRVIGGYILCLLISTTFARQVLEALTHLVGEPVVRKIPWILFGVLAVAGLFWGAVKQRVRVGRVLLALLPSVAVFLFLKGMQNPDERIHIFQYGLLGALVIYDLRGKTFWRAFGVALGIVFLTACADELFQAFLPYRVGDPRDVGFGLVGGAWGALQLWTLSRVSNKMNPD